MVGEEAAAGLWREEGWGEGGDGGGGEGVDYGGGVGGFAAAGGECGGWGEG